jgi:anti-sigma factor RsiW
MSVEAAMTCREFINFLLDYMSGELSEAERTTFDEHLAVCESCVAYLKNYQSTVEVGRIVSAELDDPLPSDVPEDLIKAILAARQSRA